MDCSLPGSSVHGIFQARTLEWGATAFSSGSSRPRDGTQVSRIVDRRFTVWATREVQNVCLEHSYPIRYSSQKGSVVHVCGDCCILHKNIQSTEAQNSLNTCNLNQPRLSKHIWFNHNVNDLRLPLRVHFKELTPGGEKMGEISNL